MKRPKWMDRFWKDFTQKEFISIKILYFLIYGGMTTLYPFLTIQAKSLGMTVDELGIVYSILPVIGILAPGIVGMCADSIGNFKIFLCIMMGISGLTSLLFLAIPQGRIVHDLPEDLPFSLNCFSSNSSFQIKEPLICDFNRNDSRMEVNVKACKYTCKSRREPQLVIVNWNENRSHLRENSDNLKDPNQTKPNKNFENNTNKVYNIIKTNTDVKIKTFKMLIKEPDLELKNNFGINRIQFVNNRHKDSNDSLTHEVNFNKANMNSNLYAKNISTANMNPITAIKTKPNVLHTSNNYMNKADGNMTYSYISNINVTNYQHDGVIGNDDDADISKKYSNKYYNDEHNLTKALTSGRYINVTNVDDNVTTKDDLIKTNTHEIPTNKIEMSETYSGNKYDNATNDNKVNTNETYLHDGYIISTNTAYRNEVDLSSAFISNINVTDITNVYASEKYNDGSGTKIPLINHEIMNETIKSPTKGNKRMVNIRKEYIYIPKDLNTSKLSTKSHISLLVNVSRIYTMKESESSFRNYDNSNQTLNKIISIDVTLQQEGLKAGYQVSHQLCPAVQKLMENKKEVYYFQNVEGDEETSRDCFLQCDVTAKSKTLCSNTQSTEDISPGQTMLIYIIVRLVNIIAISSTIPLFEGAAIAILQQHNGDFGYQRMYASLGKIILTPISGKLIDVLSALTGKEDFRPAFFMYCSIKIICAIIISFVSLEFKKPSKTVIGDVKSLISLPEVIFFLIFSLVTGMVSGFVDTFLFWFLEDMKADRSLLGLTVTIGAIFGLPFLMCSTYMIKRLGHIGTISFTMAATGIRILGYSFIYNPWLALPFEVVKSFANSIRGVASVSYISVLSSPSTLVSLQGIYGGTSHGIGRGAGSLVGGFLIKSIGTRATFQIAALVSVLSSAGYFSVHWFKFRGNDECSNDDNKPNIDKVEMVINKENSEGNINRAVEEKLELKFGNRTANGSCRKSTLKPYVDLVISNENVVKPNLSNKSNTGYDN